MWPFGCFDTGSCYVGLDVRKPMVQTKLVSFFCCFSCLSPLSSVIIGVCRHTPFFSILCKGGGGVEGGCGFPFRSCSAYFYSVVSTIPERPNIQFTGPDISVYPQGEGMAAGRCGNDYCYCCG